MKPFSWLVIILFVAGAGCKSTNPANGPVGDQPHPSTDYKPATAELIKLSGENCCAQRVAGTSQMIYLSRKRPRHEQSQVYLYDFSNQQDRRLTFHDGDDQGPHWDTRSNRLFYASTTDALKENPTFLNQALGKKEDPPLNLGARPIWRTENFDLFSSSRDGMSIDRITKGQGFEGEVTINPTKNEMVYISLFGKQATLTRAGLDGGSVARIFAGEGNDSEPKFSPDGKEIVWVRYTPDGMTSQLWIGPANGRKARTLTTLQGIQQSPSWMPDSNEILFSSNTEDASNFELYAIRKDGSCLRRLTYQLGFDGLPTAEPDGKKLLFTSDRTGGMQLYSMPFSPPPCP